MKVFYISITAIVLAYINRKKEIIKMCRRKKEDLRSEVEKKGKITYYTMSDGTKVRVLVFDSAKNPHEYSIFVIPGFLTVFQGWEKAMASLSKEFKVYYFETREKSSSVMLNRRKERNVSFHRMAYDLKEVIEQMKLDDTKYITLCSSSGGTIEIEALMNKWINPKGAVMVGPTLQYNLHRIVPILIYMVPNFVKEFFMPIFRFYMGRFHVDKNKYPEQYRKYVRAGEESNLRKIRRVIWKIGNKCSNWEMVPKVETKTLLIGATEDKMHTTEMTLRVHEMLPNSEYVDLGTNKAAHEQPLVDIMKKFINEFE